MMIIRDLPNYIGGEWLASKAEENLEVINPAIGEVLAKAPFSLLDEVDQAARAANEAFSVWQHIPAPERIQYLFRLDNLLETNFDQL